jgi:hypothetical protein
VAFWRQLKDSLLSWAFLPNTLKILVFCIRGCENVCKTLNIFFRLKKKDFFLLDLYLQLEDVLGFQEQPQVTPPLEKLLWLYQAL